MLVLPETRTIFQLLDNSVLINVQNHSNSMLFRKINRTLFSKEGVLEISSNSSVPQSHQEVLLKQMAEWCSSFSDLVDLPQVLRICISNRFPDDADTWVQDCILRSIILEHRIEIYMGETFTYIFAICPQRTL